MNPVVVEGAVLLGKAVLEGFLKKAGFDKPSVTYNSDRGRFSLVVQSVGACEGKLSLDFYSPHWWGTLLFSQTTAWFGGDTITVAMTIHHVAGGPDPEDEEDADPAPIRCFIDAEKDPNGTKTAPAITVQRPHKCTNGDQHTDQYVPSLNATIHAGKVWSGITGWTFELTGTHVKQTLPSVGMLLPNPIGGEVAVALGSSLGDARSVELAIAYDPRLGLTPANVKPGPAAGGGEIAVDVSTPGEARLTISANQPLSEPGILATLAFQLPDVVLRDEYSVQLIGAGTKEGAPLTIAAATPIVGVRHALPPIVIPPIG